jgi:hypothetical protein
MGSAWREECGWVSKVCLRAVVIPYCYLNSFLAAFKVFSASTWVLVDAVVQDFVPLLVLLAMSPLFYFYFFISRASCTCVEGLTASSIRKGICGFELCVSGWSNGTKSDYAN